MLDVAAEVLIGENIHEPDGPEMTEPTANIYTLLQKRWPSPEYALLFEVGNGTGANNTGWADAIAMSLYPSRGLDVHGIEIKAYRNDWFRELKKPDKAEQFFKYCDYWWVVADGQNIVKIDEVPSTWGLLEKRGAALKLLKPAPRLKSVKLDRSFVAAVLRGGEKSVRNDKLIQAAVQQARDEERASFARDRAVKLAHDETKQLQEAIAEFEKASGVKITYWDAGDIGKAVRFAMEARTSDMGQALESMRGQMKRVYRILLGGEKAIRKIMGTAAAVTGAPAGKEGA